LSLGDLITATSTDTTIVYDPTNEIIRWQSVENFQYLAPRQKLYRCHIASKSKYKKYRRDEDNIIYGSQDFHNYFDGMQISDEEPELAIKYLGSSAAELQLGNGSYERRFKVDIQLEFRKEDVAQYMKRRLREYEDISPLVARTFIHVTSDENVKIYLDLKYQETIQYWNEAMDDEDE
jgi:hypothetical protein